MIRTLKIHNPHHEATGETFAVIVRTALGETRVPCWTEAEAQDIRDSLLDAGMTVRVIVTPTMLAATGFFEDEADVAALPDALD
jgi:hypothetical protein